ncbi:hypothetical protein CYLTODRAFT_231604 [Cylindrobasidium torrendii FP15055 ss-10]|uniref:Uncharacterized protein n=1 Tax=Cylindrobasidium torrendii FP15055 ss-10 TaxID=1314674 RepID=A0A0D7ASF5_9AGAR|nr:hypothetical protein CYLTODRAFT_427668 [Cylindrobasidium torrendii FP15055 ss-10]KIY61283.1 hypothetical protein CYLTODRAFT_231604 [Cylindrobasidium torrendii FP15055 ss-10]
MNTWSHASRSPVPVDPHPCLPRLHANVLLDPAQCLPSPAASELDKASMNILFDLRDLPSSRCPAPTSSTSTSTSTSILGFLPQAHLPSARVARRYLCPEDNNTRRETTLVQSSMPCRRAFARPSEGDKRRRRDIRLGSRGDLHRCNGLLVNVQDGAQESIYFVRCSPCNCWIECLRSRTGRAHRALPSKREVLMSGSCRCLVFIGLAISPDTIVYKTSGGDSP